MLTLFRSFLFLACLIMLAGIASLSATGNLSGEGAAGATLYLCAVAAAWRVSFQFDEVSR